MNERIKELANKAGLKVNADGEIGPAYFGSVDAGYRKFAELIVKECGVALNPPVQNRNVISRGQAYDLIKKHFGVK